MVRLRHAFAFLLVSACTVDPGPDTGPPPTCEASTSYFVSTAWPQYFVQYNCAASGCHDASTGRGFFRLQSLAGVTAPQPTDPVTVWPPAWQDNLESVQLVLSCASPLLSDAYTYPLNANGQHPGGTLLMTSAQQSAAAQLFTTWLTQ